MNILNDSKRHCCKNCHFLAKDVVNEAGFRSSSSWNKDERDKLRVAELWAAKCHIGVWDTGVDPALNSRLPETLLEDRRDKCFFIEMHEGMLFDAARELHKLRNDNRQLKRSFRYTQWALGISAVAIVANVVVNIVK